MNALKPYVSWIIVAAALLLVYWIYNYLTAPLTIAAAINAGKVEAQVSANGDNGGSVTITLTRPSGVSGTIKVVIPSGTALYGTDPDGQHLITAVPIVVVLSDDNPSVSQQVQTFCIDEFAATPFDNAPLAFVPPENGSVITTEETEPLHKLADCMANASQSDEDKQLAVWAVSSDWLHKTRAEAVQFVTDGLAQRMGKERHDQLENKKPDLMRMAPSLSSERIDELIEAEYQNGMSELNNMAATKANEQVTSFIENDKNMLETCGYATGDMPIFQ